jgi:hypothetical protein
MMIEYGSTTNFVVNYDSSFTGGPGEPNGPALAQTVLDYCEYDLVRLSMLFGIMLPPANLPITINLVPGAGGASNDGVNVINLYCNVNTDPQAPPGIVVAEEAEIFMDAQGKGWIADWSNGEALSRVCGQILYPSRAWLFSTGNSWLNAAGRPDWVDQVEHTDQDYVSVGCGSLFLNYLAYQLNYTWPAIIGAGAPTTNTLAETATILGVANPWTNFFNLITTYLPSPDTLSPEPTSFGQPPEWTDDPFPLGPLPASVPILYMRHNLADDGTSHTGSLSDSPDIILKNNPVANPQATYSTPASIASDTESDPYVVTGQANYVYTRVWNRGNAAAANVFASVYWSPPSTLVSPNLWTLVGSAYYPNVPAGSVVEVSNPGIIWPSDQLPADGHDCFVASVGNADDPGPNPGSFASFDDFENYIYSNNNITWRNFNVGVTLPSPIKWPLGEFSPLRFQITGAWDTPRVFALETEAELPEGSRMALQVPHWLGRGLKPAPSEFEEFEDADTDPADRKRMRLLLHANRTQHLGEIELPVNTAAASHMLVHIPAKRHLRPYRVIIRQLHGGREVGRITWLMIPPR